MRSPRLFLRTRGLAGVLVVLVATACASEPVPASTDASSDSGAAVTGSTTHATTHAASTSPSSTSVDPSASTSTGPTTADDTHGTTNPDPSADDLPVPDLPTGPQPSCHPLEPDCSEPEACYPIDGLWQCAPDASGELGAYGDPCEADDACDPGLACLPTNALPPGLPCEDAAGCCTVLCDFSDPDASLGCPSAAEGQLCLPWYPPGEAPPGYDDVGVCSKWP